MRRRIAILLTALVGPLLVGHPVLADPGTGGGANNIVVVQNQADGTLHSRASAQVAQDPGPIVGNTNTADAESTCTDCRTVAVAVQVILRSGDPNVFEPGNGAVAVNSGCLRCHSFAFARQDVLTSDRPVPVGPDALYQIRDIEGQMQDVAASDLSDDEMKGELNLLADHLVDVVSAEVDRAGTSAVHAAYVDFDQFDA